MAISTDFASASQWDKNEGLLKAAWKNDLEGVRALLKAGADPRTKEVDGATALHYAARHDNTDMAQLLISADADLNAGNQDARTPLFYARGCAVAKLLIDAGAVVGARTMQGWTPLHEAVGLQKADVAKLLVAHGADPFRSCLTGETPADIATKRGYREISEVFEAVRKAPGANAAAAAPLRVKQLDLF